MDMFAFCLKGSVQWSDIFLQFFAQKTKYVPSRNGSCINPIFFIIKNMLFES